MRRADAGRFALAATAPAAMVVGCAPAGELAAREAAHPAAIALAMCAQYRPNDPAGCDKFRLPDPASEAAYAGCLDYNRKDLKPCGALRVAYEGDLHAALEADRPPAPRRVRSHRTAAYRRFRGCGKQIASSGARPMRLKASHKKRWIRSRAARSRGQRWCPTLPRPRRTRCDRHADIVSPPPGGVCRDGSGPAQTARPRMPNSRPARLPQICAESAAVHR